MRAAATALTALDEAEEACQNVMDAIALVREKRQRIDAAEARRFVHEAERFLVALEGAEAEAEAEAKRGKNSVKENGSQKKKNEVPVARQGKQREDSGADAAAPTPKRATKKDEICC